MNAEKNNEADNDSEWSEMAMHTQHHAHIARMTSSPKTSPKTF